MKYFSKALNKINEFPLDITFIGKAGSDELVKCIMKSIEKRGLDLKNWVMVGSDGPNVNKKVNRISSEKGEEIRGYGLLRTSVCPIHCLHLAFKKCVKFSFEDEKPTSDVSSLCRFVWKYFCQPANWEAYQQQFGPRNRFIQHSDIRWVTLGKSGSVILGEFENLLVSV